MSQRSCFFTVALCCSVVLGWSQSLYFPPVSGSAWDTISPSRLNWCQEQIDSLYTFLDDEETHAFLVLKDGKIVLERYFAPYGPDSLWIWFSAGKSLMATLIGIAQEEGALSIQDRTSDYLGTGWTSLSPSQEDSIRIWHQLTMTTGLDEAEFSCTDDSCLTYRAPAGSRWVYHNAPYSLLRDVLEHATGEFLNPYTNMRLENITGMSGFWLPSGYNNFYFSKARDMARFGLMIQANGYWNGAPVLGDSAYFNAMLNTSQPMNPSYGYLWWLNGKSSHIAPESPQSVPGPFAPRAPADVFTAAGSQGQFISISPSLGLVMVRQGSASAPDLAAIDLHDRIWEFLMDLECPTGMTEPEQLPLCAFPNPASQTLTIRHLKDKPQKVEVVDLQGQVQYTATGTSTLHVGHLVRGYYLLRVHTSEGVETVPILLQSPR